MADIDLYGTDPQANPLWEIQQGWLCHGGCPVCGRPVSVRWDFYPCCCADHRQEHFQRLESSA